MSRVIPIALQTELAKSTRTLTTCIHVTRTDGEEVFATTLNRPVVVSGDTYLPLGFIRKDLTAEDSMAVGTTEIEGIQDSESVDFDDVNAGLWDGAAWVMFRVNYESPSDGIIHLAEGTIGTIRMGRLRWTAELLSLMQSAQTSIGYLTSPQCIHKFGKSEGGNGRGNGCTFDLATVTDTGTVETMDADYYGINDSARTEADGYYSGGTFRVMTGLAAGREFAIRAYLEGYILLMDPVPYDVTDEDYEIVRGCDKSLETCRDTYDNVLDRLAFDYTQGNDIAIQVGRHS